MPKECGHEDCFTCPYADCIVDSYAIREETPKKSTSDKQKECLKRWREQHPNYMRDYKREYYRKNREREVNKQRDRMKADRALSELNGTLPYGKRYYADNKEAMKQKARRYYLAHKDEINAKARERRRLKRSQDLKESGE